MSAIHREAEVDLETALFQCAGCGQDFSVPLSSVMRINGERFKTSVQACTNCALLNRTRPIYWSPDASLASFFDTRLPATSGHYPVQEALAGKREFYVTPRYDPNGRVVSAIWKVWRSGKNVYVASSAFPEFKISLHESGWDNLSWIKPSRRTGLLNSPNSSRHMLKLRRTRTPDAVLMGVFRIEVSPAILFHPYWQSLVKRKRSKFPLMVNRPLWGITKAPIFRLECHYTSKPLASYKETLGLSGRLLRTFQIKADEYIHFSVDWARDPTKFVEQSMPGLSKVDAEKRRFGDLHFGRAGKGTMLVALRHLPQFG